ncbi:MAG: SH3 domain-containing protein, partial [Phototrophicaceae bacterium]
LRLIYNEGFGSVSDGVFYEAEPSKDSGLEIRADSNVNIRSGPSTNAGVVDSLASGSTVIAFGRNQDGSWVQIANGWVFASLVTTDGDIMQLPITAQ